MKEADKKSNTKKYTQTDIYTQKKNANKFVR